jgi:hypothetical protein
MTAREIPVGAVFTLEGSDVSYTVTHQVTGASPHAHMTYATYGEGFWYGSVIGRYCVALAGHTEVIAVPDTLASDATTPA